jgi:hypothetical protein
MSHGDENGVIHTDYLKSGTQPKAKRTVCTDLKDFEEYTIDDIFKSVNRNPNLTNSLKIIVIQVQLTIKQNIITICKGMQRKFI